MHSRNIYNTPPDFSELAKDVPSLKPFIKLNKQGGPTIDFKDPEALRALTTALLLRDFGRDVYLPEDRLCPPVAGRLDYILYLQDVVRHHRQTLADFGEINAITEVVGLDIGVGASAIYPMLFTAIDERVRMIGTDINDESLTAARQNVEHNDLTDRIGLVKTSPQEGFFRASLQDMPFFDFTMCNPPFYVSDEEMGRLTNEKELPPYAACTGAPNEMVTQGGEAAFVARMIQESQAYKDQIIWCSSLLGKATSVISLVKELASVGCNNYGLIESSPSHTHRWILLWSWSDVRLSGVSAKRSFTYRRSPLIVVIFQELARHLPPSSALTKSLPLPNELSYFCHAGVRIEAVSLALTTFLSGLDLQVAVLDSDREASIWRIQAGHASWTRAARRKQARSEEQAPTNNRGLLLACDLLLDIPVSEPEAQVMLKATWRRGLDRQAFESFFSTCVRKLAAIPTT